MGIVSSSRVLGVAANRPFLGMERVGGAMFRLLESLVDPLSILATLFGLMLWFRDDQYAHYLVLGVLVFSLTFPGKSLVKERVRGSIREVLLGWLGISALLAAFGLATGLYAVFPEEVLVNWF